MTFTKVILALACLICDTLVAQEAQVTSLMSKELADFPGKEGLMITVVYPPGSSDPIHRHNAHAFCLCAGRLDRDASKRRKRNDSDTRSDLLRRPE
jgi:quercetin dioxygenase-like cupin family protein